MTETAPEAPPPAEKKSSNLGVVVVVLLFVAIFGGSLALVFSSGTPEPRPRPGASDAKRKFPLTKEQFSVVAADDAAQDDAEDAAEAEKNRPGSGKDNAGKDDAEREPRDFSREPAKNSASK